MEERTLDDLAVIDRTSLRQQWESKQRQESENCRDEQSSETSREVNELDAILFSFKAVQGYKVEQMDERKLMFQVALEEGGAFIDFDHSLSFKLSRFFKTIGSSSYKFRIKEVKQIS